MYIVRLSVVGSQRNENKNIKLINMTAKSDIDRMRDTLKWAIGIMITLLIILITGAVRAEVRTTDNKEQIQKIKEDYLPYFAFEYIVESNNKLINILTAIDSKDDSRYQKAMIEWNQLNEEIVKQAGKNKTRSGGTSSMAGGQ